MTEKVTVLVVDDNRSLVNMVSNALEEEGFDVLQAFDGTEGLRQMYEGRPDIILLDINMPTMDGWTVCQRIREVSNIPLVIVTACDTPDDIIRGLDIGADDYIAKPFQYDVLMARIRSNLRRAALEPTMFKRSIIYSDDYMALNMEEHRVTVEGEVVRLTPTEFNLLAYLVDAAPRIVPYRDLLEQVWGFEYIDDIDYLRVYIWHLRRKLEPNPKDPIYIINELGLGYRFEKQV